MLKRGFCSYYFLKEAMHPYGTVVNAVCICCFVVKAGGMRIVQNKTHLKKTDGVVPKPEEESALKVSTR